MLTSHDSCPEASVIPCNFVAAVAAGDDNEESWTGAAAASFTRALIKTHRSRWTDADGRRRPPLVGSGVEQSRADRNKEGERGFPQTGRWVVQQLHSSNDASEPFLSALNSAANAPTRGKSFTWEQGKSSSRTASRPACMASSSPP